MLVFKNGKIEWTQSALVGGYTESKVGECECFSEPTTENRNGKYEDGRYQALSFKVSINMSDVPSDFNPTTIKVHRDHHPESNWLPVQRVEWYEITKTIVIWA